MFLLPSLLLMWRFCLRLRFLLSAERHRALAVGCIHLSFIRCRFRFIAPLGRFMALSAMLRDQGWNLLRST